MDIIKLNQIEELLNTLIAIIQKGFKKNSFCRNRHTKRTFENFTDFSKYFEIMGKAKV